MSITLPVPDRAIAARCGATDGCGDLPELARLRYFHGQPLGAHDLRREQSLPPRQGPAAQPAAARLGDRLRPRRQVVPERRRRPTATTTRPARGDRRCPAPRWTAAATRSSSGTRDRSRLDALLGEDARKLLTRAAGHRLPHALLPRDSDRPDPRPLLAVGLRPGAGL